MDWENLINTLNKQQEYLQEFVRVGQNLQDQYRPGFHLTWRGFQPGAILAMVESKSLHPTAPLMAMASAQIEFNKTVINMLTDLDIREYKLTQDKE